MDSFLRFAIVSAVVGGMSFLTTFSARADIPPMYKGKPFDPAVAGGPKLAQGVKAGPYTIPGRIDFINYDMGGDGTAYHAGDHLMKGGAGYRIDMPTATLSLTSLCIPNVGTAPCQNVWYDTIPTLDGTPYPSPTTADFTIGAVQIGDWFNITVNVETTGTYSVSSTWASGNAPPGGEPGDGSMGLDIFSNDVKLASWTSGFPNYNTTADFHHWKAYPNFVTVALTAGLQVIKLQSTSKHLQLDYVALALISGDAGAAGADAASSGNAAGSGDSSASGAAATSGSTSAGGGASTSGASARNGATGGSASNGGAGIGGGGDTHAAGCSCSLGGSPESSGGWVGASFGVVGLVLTRGRTRRGSR